MLLTLLLLGQRATPIKPVWTGKVAGYRMVEWEDPDRELQTLILKDRRGRVVTRITDYRVFPSTDADYLTNDKVPSIEIRTWSGGAHGSDTFYFWKLGLHPKCLLAYDKNNVIDGYGDVEVIPPSKGHRAQIKTWYDGFAYIGGSGSNFTSVIPVVFDLEGDRFVDRTTKYPQVLRKAASVAWADLAAEGGLRRPAMILIAIADLLGTLHGVWPALKHEMPAWDYGWLTEHRRDLLWIARGRFHRVAYPRAYDRETFQFKPFPSDKGHEDLY